MTQARTYEAYHHAAQEDRCAPRYKLRIPASMRPSGSSGFSVVVKDLSISGFACEALTGMKAGTRIWLKLPSLEALAAEIVWNDGTMVGCSFTSLLNAAVMDTITSRHLIDED